MKINKSRRNNIILLVIILVMVIPQTRQPIQILLHKGLALFSPSVVDEEERVTLKDYNWKLVDDEGNSLDFSEAKGKVVFVSFWATWCPPCIAEMPNIEKLYQDYKNDVVFLLVSNEEQEVISTFKEKKGYDFKVYSSVTKHPDAFETRSIPRTYILDRKGTIVVDKSGAADWNSNSVRDLLDTLLSE